MKLSLDKANMIADRTLAKAREAKYRPMCVAVLDDGGCLKVLKREDNATILRPDIAIGKAWGAVGMGESRKGRAGLIAQLANLDPYPESVPINSLVQVEGTPLHAQFGGVAAIDPIEFVRTIAAARITMPKAMVRLSAGRRELACLDQGIDEQVEATHLAGEEQHRAGGQPDHAAENQ